MTLPLIRPGPKLIHVHSPRAATLTCAAGIGDWPRLDALQRRCSGDTVYETWGQLRITADQAQRLLLSPHTLMLVTAPRGQPGYPVALTQLASIGGEPPEIGLRLMVDDAWQQRSLGTQLARYASELAREAGYYVLSAHLTADNIPMLKVLRALGADPAPSAKSHLDVHLPLGGSR
jgi:GNAT superfamily N-acetyltransferase